MMNGLVERFAGFSGDLLALQLRAAGLLAITMLVAYLLRRGSASVRHRVWAFGLAAVVALPLVTPWLPLFELGREREVAQRDVAAQRAEGPIDVDMLIDDGAAIGPAVEPATPRSISPGWWVAAWVAGAALIAGRTLVGMVGLASLRRRSRPPGATLSRRLAALEPRVDLRVMVSDDVTTPMVGGLLRPVVLLPATFESCSTDRLQLVLAHELGHVRQGDHRWVLVSAFARAMCWPNPLVWLASAQLRKTAECAADDAVLATGVRPSTYAAELVAFARELGRQRSPSLGLSIVGRSSLATRIGALLRDDQRRGAAALTFVIPLAIGSLGTAASFAMLHVCQESRAPVGTPRAADEDVAVEASPPAAMARVRIGLDRIDMKDETRRTAASIPLDQGRLAADALQGHLVTALHEKFGSTTLHVQADDAVPFGTVVDVLYTAGRGGVRSWVFAWKGRELGVNPPRFEADAPKRPDDLRLRWTADEIVFERVPFDRTTANGSGCIAMPRHARAAAFVADLAADACDQCTATGCPALRLAPAADTPYAEAMAVAAAVADATRACNVELVVEAGEAGDASNCEHRELDIGAFMP